MIGQHKRSLDYCVSLPPSKCLKQHENDDESLVESGVAEDEEVVDIDPAAENRKNSTATIQFQLQDHKVRFDDSSTEACLKGFTPDLSSDPTRDNSSSQEISSLELCFPVQESSISSPAPTRFFQAALEGLLPRIRGVPIGPDYQAEVPHWNPSEKDRDIDEETKLWYGDRIWPSSTEDIKPSADVGRGRRELCGCEDHGSVECVRRHIDESRERVAREVGPCVSAKLGLDEMGECVARKWTEQEEKTFAELVRFNPASQRRNFWIPLRYAFPSRRRRELVSYYFNVFVLRRRALQNRFDRENVDSDDDESDLPPPVLDEEEWESEYTDDEEVAAAAAATTVVGAAVAEEEEEEEEDWDGEDEEEEDEEEAAKGREKNGVSEPSEVKDDGGGGGGGGDDEFARFSSKDGGGFAREETEKEILRLSRALDHHHGFVGEMELASTNGAMQEFFGREADGNVWESRIGSIAPRRDEEKRSN